MTIQLKFFRLFSFTVLALSMCAAACSPAQLTQIQDASSKRDVICEFVVRWEPTSPDLATARKLCEAGASLKDVASAYAQCMPER